MKEKVKIKMSWRKLFKKDKKENFGSIINDNINIEIERNDLIF